MENIIEYTVTLTNNTSESKIVGLMDISPMCNSSDYLNGFGSWNYDISKKMKFGMVGYTKNYDYNVENYRSMTKQYTGFANNCNNKVENRGSTGASIYCEVEIPANSELKQTYILAMPKTVQNGEQYKYSYDAFLNIVRYNSKYSSSPYATSNYKIPYNYIYVYDHPEINALVYHKVEARYYVQTGVLARNTYQDMMDGNAIIDMYNTDLSKFAVSDNEIITYYAYFINDSIYELNMEDTTINLKIPSVFSFLGFNTIQENTLNKYNNGTATRISSPISSTRFNKKSYYYNVLWANDFRGNNSQIYKNYYYSMNNYYENNDIYFYSHGSVYGSFSINASGTLKPGQSCYIIYSCRASKDPSENYYREDQNGVNYVQWNINNSQNIKKSNSYEVIGFYGKYTSNMAKKLNDGKCYDYKTMYDSEKGIKYENQYSSNRNFVWSAVKIEPSNVKSAQIKKQAVFAYNKDNNTNTEIYILKMKIQIKLK